MARTDMGNRPDKTRVTLLIAGQSFGVWPKQSGGEKDSGESKYRPGGMESEESIGGVTTHGNVTLQRIYDHDLFARIDAVPSGTAVQVIRQPLDNAGLAYGEAAIAWEGTLKRSSAPDVDADADGEPGLMEVEITVAKRSVS